MVTATLPLGQEHAPGFLPLLCFFLSLKRGQTVHPQCLHLVVALASRHPLVVVVGI